MKTGKHEYLVAPVCKVVIFSRYAQQVKARYIESRTINKSVIEYWLDKCNEDTAVQSSSTYFRSYIRLQTR